MPRIIPQSPHVQNLIDLAVATLAGIIFAEIFAVNPYGMAFGFYLLRYSFLSWPVRGR